MNFKKKKCLKVTNALTVTIKAFSKVHTAACPSTSNAKLAALNSISAHHTFQSAYKKGEENIINKIQTKRENSIADDSCLFCGRHYNIAGGHYYTGFVNDEGNIEDSEGGLVIEHLSHCAVQICPDCHKKLKIARLIT